MIARFRHHSKSAIVKFQSLIAGLREDYANLNSANGINHEVTKAIRAKVCLEISDKYDALNLEFGNDRKQVVMTTESSLKQTKEATDNGETFIRLQSQSNELTAMRGTI